MMVRASFLRPILPSNTNILELSLVNSLQSVNVKSAGLAITLLLTILSALGVQRWASSKGSPELCEENGYSTEILSIDPLVVYINNFVSLKEAVDVVALGSSDLEQSLLTTPDGKTAPASDRTSSSAGLPPNNPTISCILHRSHRFLGSLIRIGIDDISTPQLVNYEPTQKFDLHHDWYDAPVPYRGGQREGRWWWNRIGSFFVYLDLVEPVVLSNISGDAIQRGDQDIGGETWFPHLDFAPGKDGDSKWRKHEEGGIAFRPIPGNAIFWVNLHQGNWSGDWRTVHAGLPLKGEGGRKTAMNIWPRRFFRGPRTNM